MPLRHGRGLTLPVDAPPQAQPPRVPEPPRRLVPPAPPRPRVRLHGIALVARDGEVGRRRVAARRHGEPRTVVRRVQVHLHEWVRRPEQLQIHHAPHLGREPGEEGRLGLLAGRPVVAYCLGWFWGRVLAWRQRDQCRLGVRLLLGLGPCCVVVLVVVHARGFAQAGAHALQLRVAALFVEVSHFRSSSKMTRETNR